MAARAASTAAFFAAATARIAVAVAKGRGPHVAVVVNGGPFVGAMAPLQAAVRSVRFVHWVLDVHPDALLALRPADRLLRAAAPVMRFALDATWNRADVVGVISPRMLERLAGRVPRHRLRLLPLWAPAGVAPVATGAPQLRRARGLGPAQFVTAYHGNFGLAYDFAPLLDAAALLAAEPEYALVMVGDGPRRAAVQAEAAQRGLNATRFLDPVPPGELGDSHAMADVLLVTAREGWDGVAFPSKLITALAAGRPVIVVAPPGAEIGELVEQAGAGRAVPPDGAALAAAIRALRADPDAVQRQGRAAARLATERFDRALAFAAWDRVLAGLPASR